MIQTDTAKTNPADIEQFRRLLRRDPDSLRFAELADLFRRHGSLSEATAVCARGLLRHSSYATGHVVMGEIFQDQGLEDKAENEWQEALRIDSGHPRAHLRLGQLYLRRGDLTRAQASLEAALLWNPDLDDARELLSQIRGTPSGSAPAEMTLRRPAEGLISTAQVGDVLDAVQACECVDSVMLTNADGLPLAGAIQAIGEAGAAMAVELVSEARQMAMKLGFGGLRAVLVRATGGDVRCIAIDGFTLIAALTPNTPLGAADLQLREAVARVACAGEGAAGG